MTKDSARAELKAVVDSGGSALEFLLLKFRDKANDPTSQYFLPLLLSTVKEPTIFPVLTASQWEFTLGGFDGQQLAQNICISTGPFDQNQIPSSSSAVPDITLGQSNLQPKGNLQVKGLIDASLGTPVVSGANQDIVTVSIAFGAWDPKVVPASLQPGLPAAPNALVIDGTFTISQSCCYADDSLKNCQPGTTNTQIGWGSFQMAFGAKSGTNAAANVTGSAISTVTVASMQPPQVAIAISQIQLNVADLDQVNTTVDVTSIPPDQHRAEWNIQANKAMNDNGVKGSIIANVNAVLGSPSNRKAIETLLEDQMNAYLKSLFG